jgi:hypothetical protein
MPLAAAEASLQKNVARYLKARIRNSSITYDELVRRLDALGWSGETSNAIRSKLKRGTFAATFFIGVLAALDEKEVRLDDVRS